MSKTSLISRAIATPTRRGPRGGDDEEVVLAARVGELELDAATLGVGGNRRRSAGLAQAGVIGRVADPSCSGRDSSTSPRAAGKGRRSAGSRLRRGRRPRGPPLGSALGIRIGGELLGPAWRHARSPAHRRGRRSHRPLGRRGSRPRRSIPGPEATGSPGRGTRRAWSAKRRYERTGPTKQIANSASFR